MSLDYLYFLYLHIFRDQVIINSSFFHDSYGSLFFALISGSLISLYFYKNYFIKNKF